MAGFKKWLLALSRAEKTGVAALSAALFLFLAGSRLAWLPLLVYLALCLVAPFLPQFGFFLPIISRGRRGARAVALTFDDGPSPESTLPLLELLARYQLTATFFVTGRLAFRYPSLLRAIVEGGHTLGNHSFSHDSLLMLRSQRRLRREVALTQRILRRAGIVTRVFRPPAGVSNSRLKGVLATLELDALNFSCRIFDRGNRQIEGLSARVLARLAPGDILLLHDTLPEDEERGRYWLRELERLFQGLQAREFTVLPLAELIGRPVMVMKNGRKEVALLDESASS